MARTVTEYLQMMCPSLPNSGFSDIYIELATDETSATFFGEKYYNYAIALRAAHNYTIDTTRGNGAGGLITAKQEGRMQMSFLHNMNRQSRSDLLLTMYGMKLQSLIRSRGPIVSIANTGIDLDANTFAAFDEDYL
jgi:hypothetical protein